MILMVKPIKKKEWLCGLCEENWTENMIAGGAFGHLCDRCIKWIDKLKKKRKEYNDYINQLIEERDGEKNI